jgi:DNA-binding GntR family transcriptional regulator
MLSTNLQNPEFWRFRAEEVLTLSENLKHAETKKIMARIAEDYERIVKIVEQHLRDIRQILSKISS